MCTTFVTYSRNNRSGYYNPRLLHFISRFCCFVLVIFIIIWLSVIRSKAIEIELSHFVDWIELFLVRNMYTVFFTHRSTYRCISSLTIILPNENLDTKWRSSEFFDFILEYVLVLVMIRWNLPADNYNHKCTFPRQCIFQYETVSLDNYMLCIQSTMSDVYHFLATKTLSIYVRSAEKDSIENQNEMCMVYK